MSPIEDKYLQFALQAAGIGTWSLDIAENSVWWDESCKKLYGFSKDDNVPYSEVLRHIHPDDAPAVQEAVACALNPSSGGKYIIRFRTIGADDGRLRWLHCQGKAYFDEHNNPIRFSGIAQDITEQVAQQEETRVADQLAQQAMESAHAGWVRIRMSDGSMSYSSQYAILITGDPNAAMTRGDFQQYIHPDDIPVRNAAMSQAHETNIIAYRCRVIWNDGSIHWLQLNGSYHRDADGTPLYFFGIASEVTTEQDYNLKIAASEARFRSLIEQAPVGTCLFTGREMKIEIANSIMLGYWGKGNGAIGKPLSLAVPELVGQPFATILDEIYLTGMEYTAQGMAAQLEVDGVMATYYFDFTYKPVFDAGGNIYGIMDMAVDVTDRVKAEQFLTESELYAKSIIEHSPIAKVVFIGKDLVISTINAAMKQVLGIESNIIGHKIQDVIPAHNTISPVHILQQVLQTGVPVYNKEMPAQWTTDGESHTRYFDLAYIPLRNSTGQVYGIINSAVDITEQMLIRENLVRSGVTLNNAIEMSEMGMFTYDTVADRFDYSERLLEWFEQPNGTSLETALYIIDLADKERIKEKFTAAITDSRNESLEEEFTIRSAKTRRLRILHVKTQTIFDHHNNIQKIFGIVRDVTMQRQMQTALEQEVQVRTEETEAMNEELVAVNEELNESNRQLVRSNEELTQYAYVASHDLQEPLRKIRTFSGMLSQMQGVPESGLHYIARISQSAERLSLLISDLLNYSRLLKSETMFTDVDLQQVLHNVVRDFELVIEEKDARISIGALPAIQAVALQMNQLFYNLVSNALKFVSPGKQPQITVTAQKLTKEEAYYSFMHHGRSATYYLISISDNGIGFESEFKEQIFEVFKRLHNRDIYPGSGVGLALCRRIVTNHQGTIKVNSEPGKGTTFSIVLPDKPF